MAKICPNCGAEIQENYTFCAHCGTKIAQTNQSINQEDQQNYDSQHNGSRNFDANQSNQTSGLSGQQENNRYQNAQSPYGQPENSQQTQNQQYNSNQQGYYRQNYNQPMQNNQPPMNWFKFIIYFQLFVGAFLNFCTGIVYLTGAIYNTQGEGAAELIYLFYPSMSAIDKIYGLGLIALAVFAIVTRMKLAKYCKIGPTLYFIYCGVSIVLVLFYLVGVISVVGMIENISSLVGNIIGLGILLVINVVYFKKREFLFVN